VEEDSYRQSRLCRLLGNPVAFAVVQLLAENNELNPSEICPRRRQKCATGQHRARRATPGGGRALRHGWEAQPIPAQTPPVKSAAS